MPTGHVSRAAQVFEMGMVKTPVRRCTTEQVSSFERASARGQLKSWPFVWWSSFRSLGMPS